MSTNADEDIPLPEGAIETHRVVVRSYLNPDGSSGYSTHTRGDAPASSYLGLLLFAQRDILEWSN